MWAKYICGRVPGDRVSSKNGRFGVHLKGRFGDRAFSHYKNRHFRGKAWQQQEKGQMSQIAPPEPRALFCRNTHLNLCTGHLAAKPLWLGVALIRIGFFEAHIVQGLFACTNWKYVCVKMPSFCIFQNFVFWSSECLFLRCARFSARFVTREQFGNICVLKNAFFLCVWKILCSYVLECLFS